VESDVPRHMAGAERECCEGGDVVSITHPSEPVDGRALLEAHVSELLAYPDLARRALAGAHEDPLDVAQPHRSYTLTLADVRAHRELATLEPDGWRYVVFAGPRAVAAVELEIILTSRQLHFAHVNAGPLVEAWVNALHAAEQMPDVAHADFELRLLRAPELLFVGLWLHGARDLVLPVSATVPGFAIGTPYAGPDVLTALRLKLQSRGG